MKIAILGGSFDPPHLGHLFIASQVQEHLGMDEVWLLPVYHHPFQKSLSDAQTRLEMTKLLETKTIKVSDFEIQQNPKSFTIDTLNALTTNHTDDTFYWITGSDQLEHFQKYKDWQDIISKHNLIIFPREWMLPQLEEKVKSSLHLAVIPPNITVMQTKDLMLTNISATKIRERVKANMPIDLYLPKSVAAYIIEKQLYAK